MHLIHNRSYEALVAMVVSCTNGYNLVALASLNQFSCISWSQSINMYKLDDNQSRDHVLQFGFASICLEI